MNRFVEHNFDDTELPTQGVNFSEKTVTLQHQDITLSLWDIGGASQNESMLPLVYNDAVAMLLMFDPTDPATLDALRDWHRKARERNRFAMPVLVATKYDLFVTSCSDEQQRHVIAASHAFADAIGAPLVYCSSLVPINVTNLFKVVLTQLFGLERVVPAQLHPDRPILKYGKALPEQPQRSFISSVFGGFGAAAGHSSGASASGNEPGASHRVSAASSGASCAV
jgi:GTP-binding protein of the ras superfamily involved in termination of M-phase